MGVVSTAPPAVRSTPRAAGLWVFGVLALALGLRILHLSSALQSPLSFQPGPDEDYYQRFGEAVAAGEGADAPEFTFMDPGYGYLVGFIFRMTGVNPFAVFLFQALLDTATAFGIVTIGRMMSRPRAGLLGALLYGLTATAIMFCAALVKEICVASFVIWWLAGALAVARSGRAWAWVCFGIGCGAGIALRSTLVLLAGVALALPWFTRPAAADDVATAPRLRRRASDSGLVLFGLLIALLPWSLRNHAAFGSFSPLPHNGGIVLHQAYNAQNPTSAIWIPDFVNYLHPSEIWRGYAAEAERRAGHALGPRGIDAYWRDEALQFMGAHPGLVLEHLARKGLAFLSATDIPNDRSAAEERLFSPVLRALPPPTPWLLALGFGGLLWFGLQDRRWLVVVAPIGVAWVTVAVFWAEDRFRFHAAPVLALCGGLLIDGIATAERRRGALGAGLGLAALVGLASITLGKRSPAPPIRWDPVVWGYIKMGKIAEARTLAERIAVQQPDNAPIAEALGYIAASAGRFAEAEAHYRHALVLRPRSYLAHYDLAKTLLALGRKTEAADEARVSMELHASADTAALIAQIDALP